ncbi:MAG: hypothetical protein KKE31_01635 [Planctomycetes bacterium]|nr:hypothetical protein [Planctomycetota bacterium]
MWNIFEYPFTGIAAAIVSMIAIWLFRILKPDKKHWWQMLVPAVIIVSSFAIAFFVQTDREKILGAVNKGIKAFEERKIEPIREIIADDYFDAVHSSKEYIIAYCQALFETAMIDRVTFISRKTEIENNQAVFTTEAFVKFAEESEIAKMGKPFLIVKARFYFKKTPDKSGL